MLQECVYVCVGVCVGVCVLCATYNTVPVELQYAVWYSTRSSASSTCNI